MRNIVSLSGGKDSVALWLWARRAGLDPVAVYVDTGWEWDGHHQHLDLLEARIGRIHRIAAAETFEAVTRRKKSFPSRVRKWCTEELKLKPFAAWLDAFREQTGDEVTVLLGIRRDESAKRADAMEREWSDFYDCEVWRPILEWTVEDVIAEHRRAAIPMHPLYHEGAERVGCFPCVNASKAELEIVGRMAPERIDRIRAMEAEMGATMFTRDRRTEKAREIAEWTAAHPDEIERYERARAEASEKGERLPPDPWEGLFPSVEPVGIDEVMAWAKTERGGKQLSLVRMPTGCARWGVCERPADKVQP